MLPQTDYVKASSVAHALDMLHQYGTGAAILAGGTDLIVDMRERRREPTMLVDISSVEELAELDVSTGNIRIGAGVTVAGIAGTAIVQHQLPLVTEVTRHFADYLTRNRATIGGNLANASPGADLVPPLLALNASVVLATAQGERTVDLNDFLVGPRRTLLLWNELVRAIHIPTPVPRGQAYEKLGLRTGGAIAVVSCAVSMDQAGGECRRVRIGLGAVAPRAFRSSEAEQIMEGHMFSNDIAARAAEAAANSSQPISDVRGSAEYRHAMVRALVERALHAAYERSSEPQE